MAALRLLRAFAHANGRLTAAVLAVAVAGGLLAPAFAIATGVLVHALGDGGSVAWPLGAIFVIFTFGRLLDPVREQLGEAMWRQLDESVAQRLMRTMSRPPGLAHVESPEVRDRVAQVEGSVTGVTAGEAGWWLGPAVLLWVQGLVSLAIVVRYRWWMAIALALAYAFAYRVSRRHWHDVTLVLMGRTPRLRHSYYLRTLALEPDVAKETRVFGLADWMVERYRQGWLGEMQEIWRTRHEGWLTGAGSALLVGVVELVAVGWVAWDGAHGALSLGVAVTLTQAIVGASVLATYVDGNWFLSEFVRTLDRLDSLEEEGSTSGGLAPGGARPAAGLPARAIRFEGVTFAYPGSEQPVFRRARPRDRRRPLARDRRRERRRQDHADQAALPPLRPDAGAVLVDGVDLRELDPDSWHRRVAPSSRTTRSSRSRRTTTSRFGALQRRRRPGRVDGGRATRGRVARDRAAARRLVDAAHARAHAAARSSPAASGSGSRSPARSSRCEAGRRRADPRRADGFARRARRGAGLRRASSS